jgi:hypothetical protein
VPGLAIGIIIFGEPTETAYSTGGATMAAYLPTPDVLMKKLLVTVALLVGAMGAVGAAQAQVHFDSGSARPINPRAAEYDMQRHRAHPPMRVRERTVRCRDGARRIARMCRGHGGVARR